MSLLAKIDTYRELITVQKKVNFEKSKPSKNKIKFLHVTNFNERHNGRLYNTGKRLNNGFIRLNHSVLEFSDRDIVGYV